MGEKIHKEHVVRILGGGKSNQERHIELERQS
jgi:hypothetical protein